MTYEEMERTRQFILDQQATQISTNVHRHDENLLVIEIKLHGLEDVILKLADSHVLLANSHKELALRLAESHGCLEEAHKRLDAFIVFVEKHISSRNGGEQAAQ